MKLNFEVFILTFNRSQNLRETLQSLANSFLKDVSITILDNCSTDVTRSVAESFQSCFRNLEIITHSVNIGASANLLRAVELSTSKYLWILCDDDFIDIKNFEDVIDILNEGEVDLIHVGAHPQKEWICGGSKLTPRELSLHGYPYFKFSSFLPCNIFKADVFKNEYLISGYKNIVNDYPHMPFLVDHYRKDKSVYISKNQIVIARTDGQSYNRQHWFKWWMRTSELLENKNEIRHAFLDQWRNNNYSNDLDALSVFLENMLQNKDREYFSFITKYFTLKDKLLMGKLFFLRIYSNWLKSKST